MNKYTELDQALLDSSLAIITNDINTLKELNSVYIKYKTLPKRYNINVFLTIIQISF